MSVNRRSRPLGPLPPGSGSSDTTGPPSPVRDPHAQADRSFRLFVASVKDYAIFMLDPAGHVISWNAGAERIKGYKPDEIIGSHFSRFYPVEDIRAGKPDRELEIAAVEGRIEDEGWRVRRDGSRFWANVVITAVRDDQGHLTGFGKVTRDMTEVRERLEENRRLAEDIQRHADELEQEVRDRTSELRATNIELQHANAALQTFTHTIAHDLRGPLRTIQGFAGILIQDHSEDLSQDGRDYADRIATAARRLDALVQNLLTYARLARSGAIAALEPVSWDQVVEATIRELQPEILMREARIDVRRPLGCVLGHRDMLEITVGNLLTNALKFVSRSTRPCVEIRSDHDDARRLRLSIRDNGIGVPFEEQGRIFTPFERLHANAVFSGSGLGLAIVREAIHRMGGEVGVDSDGQTGSTFWVKLRRASLTGENASA